MPAAWSFRSLALLIPATLFIASIAPAELDQPPRPNHLEKRIIKAIKAGDLETVQSLWSDDIDVNRRFPYWPNTYLFGAARSTNPDLVAWLLDRGAAIDEPSRGENPLTPIHAAARDARLENVRLLAERGATLDPLSAVALNDTAAIRRFIESEPDLLDRTWAFWRISEDETLLHFAAAYGNVEAIQTLIELGADPKAEDGNGFSALYLAAAWKNADAVRELLQHDDRVNRTNRYGWSPLRAAARFGGDEAAEALLEAGAELDIFSAAALGRLADVERFVEADPSVLGDQAGLETPLTWAVVADQPKIVERLIELGADVNGRAQNMENAPLQKAAWDNNLRCAKLLIEAGADLNVGRGEDAYGTPLHHAAWRGHDEMVTLLVDAGVNIEAVDNTHETPLCFATDQQHIETMKLLLARGAEPNGAAGQPPLTDCVDHDDISAAKLLLEAGAKVSAKDRHVGSPLHFAIQRGNMAMTELLLDRPIDRDVRGENNATLLHLAPLARDTPIEWRTKLIDRLIEMGFDLEADSYGGYTVLARAVYNRKEPKIIRHLIDRGAKVNALTDRNASVLHVACYGNQVEIVEMLIDNGARLDIADKAGKLPLHLVIGDSSNEAKQIVQMMLEAGANVDARTMAHLGWFDALEATLNDDPDLLKQPAGKTLLHVAAAKGDLKMVKMLIGQGAAVDGVDEGGMSAMHRAALADEPAVVAYLLEKGADPDQTGRYQHALYSAAIAGSAEITKMLIDAGAEIDKKTRYQYTALSQAAGEGELDVVRVLVEAGAEINRITKANETAVTAAIDAGHVDVVKYLLDHGGTLEGVGGDYSPLLHDAATRDSPEMLKFLLTQGLWVNQPNERGDTALDWAVPDDPRNAKLLRKAGALPGHLIFKDPKIAELLVELDDDRFEHRETADAALRAIGRGLLPALRQYLKQTESAEARLRVEKMITDFEEQD